mmetsp:Transcript_7406/g.8082  ORF Transcript_7406/g.8082 Transcript_7406/m.8082 type:complete len:237 (+) Transcript_7406:3-713(+)
MRLASPLSNTTHYREVCGWLEQRLAAIIVDLHKFECVGVHVLSDIFNESLDARFDLVIFQHPPEHGRYIVNELVQIGLFMVATFLLQLLCHVDEHLQRVFPRRLHPAQEALLVCRLVSRLHLRHDGPVAEHIHAVLCYQTIEFTMPPVYVQCLRNRRDMVEAKLSVFQDSLCIGGEKVLIFACLANLFAEPMPPTSAAALLTLFHVLHIHLVCLSKLGIGVCRQLARGESDPFDCL